MKAIRVHSPGGLEALRLDDVPDPHPSAGEAVVRIEAAGVNFIDVYHRTGLYKVPTPFVPGQEAAGTVESVGEGVTLVAPGDVVAWAGVMGSYAERAKVAADRLVPVPDGVEAASAAAAMLQGMTAHYLATSTRPLRDGDTCVVHAAAGGVGLLLVQVARLRGARVIGVVSTDAKAERARDAGAHEVLVAPADLAAEVSRLTDGRGAEVVYDGVGLATWRQSLGSLARRGMLVLFGNASGPVPPVDPLELSARSVFLTRPRLWDYAVTREELLERASDVLEWVRSGRLRLHVHAEYPLAEAARAHSDLEGRRTVGKLLLRP